MRTVVCVAGAFLCLASSGCQQYIANQISPQASTYNSAVSKATSQQLLDNIAGVYNHEMPAFMDVSYVTIGNNYIAPSLTLDQSALNYPGNFFSGMSAELGLSPTYWSPTVGFTPSSGSQMVKPLFAPFTLNSLSEIIYSHTNLNLLLHLLIKRVTPIGSQESINLGRYKGANVSDKDQRNVNNLFNLIQKIYKQ